MSQDNARLAIIISGGLSAIIVIFIGMEAVVHDGAIANTIVDTLSKVLGVLVVAITGISSVAKVVEAKLAGHGVVPSGSTVVSSPGQSVTVASASSANSSNGGSDISEPESSLAGGTLADVVIGSGVD